MGTPPIVAKRSPVIVPNRNPVGSVPAVIVNCTGASALDADRLLRVSGTYHSIR